MANFILIIFFFCKQTENNFLLLKHSDPYRDNWYETYTASVKEFRTRHKHSYTFNRTSKKTTG